MYKSITADIHADPHRLDQSLSVSDGRKIAFFGDFIDAVEGLNVADDCPSSEFLEPLAP